nr:hypothetical protein [Tanacetum cinerariifolium]
MNPEQHQAFSGRSPNEAEMVQRIENKTKTNPALEQLVLVVSLRSHTTRSLVCSAGGLYIPSATSAADVAATWTCGTQSADVALPRGLTWDQHVDVGADMALSEWATWQPKPNLTLTRPDPACCPAC